MRSLPHRTEADDSVINKLLMALRGGAEHAQQRGTLMAFIAQCQSAYTRLYGIEGMYYTREDYPELKTVHLFCRTDPFIQAIPRS